MTSSGTLPLGGKTTVTVGPAIENYYMLAATPSVYKPGALKAFKLGGHGAAFGASTSVGAGIKYEADNGLATSVTVNSKGAAGKKGFLTDEDTNKVNAMLAYTKDNYHISATYTKQSGSWDAWEYFSTAYAGIQSDSTKANYIGDIDADGYALRAWFRPDNTGTFVPSISVGFDSLSFAGTKHKVAKDLSGGTILLNWQDIIQPDDRIGIGMGKPMYVTATKNGVDKHEVDPFLWEAYYSFRPNDSMEIIPAIFGGSEVHGNSLDDLFGAVLSTKFKF